TSGVMESSLTHAAASLCARVDPDRNTPPLQDAHRERRGQTPQVIVGLSQAERLEAYALAAGEPVRPKQWILNPPDGGSPIWHARTRVSEMERVGYRFSHVKENGETVYYLASLPVADEPGEPEQLSLEAKA